MTILENMIAESYAYGLWAAVAINSGIFVLFTLSFLKPRKRWGHALEEALAQNNNERR